MCSPVHVFVKEREILCPPASRNLSIPSHVCWLGQTNLVYKIDESRSLIGRCFEAACSALASISVSWFRPRFPLGRT